MLSVFFRVIFVFLVTISVCFAKEIPIEVKLEYASKMNEGFHWQAVGQSTTAFAVFDQGYQKAIEHGESPENLSIILRLFSWYRTYGRYLGIMAPYVHDYDKIYGEYPRGMAFLGTNVNMTALPSPELEARRREFLLGFGEIISGLLGVWLIPNPTAKRVAFSVALDGGKRFWKMYQDVKLERDYALYELKKITDSVEQIAKNN